MNGINTVKIEINFQDMELPIYKCFGGIEGYCVLWGKNKRSLNFDWLRDSGNIEDINSVEVEYVPFLNIPSPAFEEYIKRLEKASAFPIDLPIWLVGSFTPGKKTWHGKTPNRISIYNIGEKEEFVRPDLLE
jgi:hypothetical protein